MKYTMSAGILHFEASSSPLARIRGSMLGPAKRICLQDDSTVLKAEISHPSKDGQPGDLRNRLYTLQDMQDHRIAEAQPDYAEGEDPNIVGWPINRLPRVDHARLTIHGADYCLFMHNNQEYSLQNAQGRRVLHITHRKTCGEWVFEDEQGFEAPVLCGLFVFCRYLEQENEFLIV